MNHLFIGGPADGDEIDVPEGMKVFRVADTADQSLSIAARMNAPRTSTEYTRRIVRKWNESGGFAETWYYFAKSSLTDEQAFARWAECIR